MISELVLGMWDVMRPAVAQTLGQHDGPSIHVGLNVGGVLQQKTGSGYFGTQGTHAGRTKSTIRLQISHPEERSLTLA